MRRWRPRSLSKADGGVNETSDEALLAATAGGDARAFALLVTRYSPRVLAFAQAVLRNPAEAEDVAQEVFVKLWQNAAGWQAERAQLSTWLFRVTRNAAINYSQRVRSPEQAWNASVPDPAGEALEAEIERTEQAQQLQAAIAALPEKQRSAMALVYGQGMRQKEAAAVMSLSLKAFEALLVRARRSLRDTLAVVPSAQKEHQPHES